MDTGKKKRLGSTSTENYLWNTLFNSIASILIMNSVFFNRFSSSKTTFSGWYHARNIYFLCLEKKKQRKKPDVCYLNVFHACHADLWRTRKRKHRALYTKKLVTNVLNENVSESANRNPSNSTNENM